MKKIIVISVIVVALFPAIALAEVKTSLSLKMWANSWKATITDQATNQKTSQKSDDAVLMAGPAVSLNINNKFFVGATYLVTTSDYEWTQKGTDPFFGNYTNVDSSDRKDLDIVGGFMFTPRFGMYVGYKKIDSTSSYKYTTQFGGSGSGTYGTDTLTGPGLGILGNIPFGKSPVALYGNLGFFQLKDEFKDATTGATTSVDMSGASVELGVSYMISNMFSANIGYKVQEIDGTYQGTKQENNFSGITAGINLIF